MEWGRKGGRGEGGERGGDGGGNDGAPQTHVGYAKALRPITPTPIAIVLPMPIQCLSGACSHPADVAPRGVVMSPTLYPTPPPPPPWPSPPTLHYPHPAGSLARTPFFSLVRAPSPCTGSRRACHFTIMAAGEAPRPASQPAIHPSDRPAIRPWPKPRYTYLCTRRAHRH